VTSTRCTPRPSTRFGRSPDAGWPSGKIVEHDQLLDRLTEEAAPTLREAFGIGPDVAAEMLIVFADNPERIHSEAAFAKLYGVCPIPASSGLTNKHRLYRGGHRQANAALYRAAA
jgi:transposase